MTKLELLNKILSLVPDAKVAIFDTDQRSNADDGVSSIKELSGFLVVWNPTNSSVCPTQDEIDA